MAIDPSIVAGIHQFKAPTALDVMSLQDLATRSKINQQTLEEKVRANQQQNALLQILQAPNAVGPDGTLTPETLMGVARVDPSKAAALQQQKMQMTLQNMAFLDKKMALGRNWEEAGLNAYDRKLQETGNAQEAEKAFHTARQATIEEQQRSGQLSIFSPQEIETARQQQRPIEVTRALVQAQGGKIEPVRASSPIGNLETDYRMGRISEQDYKEQKAKLLAPTNTTLMMSGQLDLPPETAKFIAKQYLAGDNSAVQGFARNARAKAQIATAITEEAKSQGMEPKDVANAVAEFQGEKSAQRTLGTRTANIEMAATEARGLADLARKASAEWSRSNIRSFNDLQKVYQSKTSSPELRKAVAATTSFINAYARAINPQGVGTVADKEHAMEMIAPAFAKGDYDAAIDQMIQEIETAQKSPGKVKESMRERFTGKKTIQEERKTAPQAALDYLKAHPEAADHFKAKYGYLP